MLDWLAHSILSLVDKYGYVAIFVYMILETAFILHFAPSEVVVPVAASQLVHGPVSFVLFVVDATVGATIGSVLGYYVFGKGGESVLQRYGRYLHISESDLERSQRWFQRWGESSVFWGRMLPLMRAVISIPAGLSNMNVRKFVTYSAGGALIFNTLLTYLVYNGSNNTSPLGWMVGLVTPEIAEASVYVHSHPFVVAIECGVLLAVLGIIWINREYVRQHPIAAQHISVRVVRGVGIVGCGLLLGSALVTPHQSFRAITSFWDEPLIFSHLGVAPQGSLLLTGFGVLVFAFALSEAGKRIPVSRLIAKFDDREATDACQ